MEAFPGKIDPLSPSDATEGAELLPTKGDATTDVYATGEGSGEHLALVAVEPHKELDPGGNWKESEVSLEPVPDGWRYTDLSGLAFTFPKVLSKETPVVVEAGSGSMTSSPENASDAVVDGTSITYPGAAGGNDLVYRATHLGVQEQIVLVKAPEDTTFRFVVTTKGLSLELNPYGGIDLIGADGKPVATIPAAVADDSSPDIASDTATYELASLDDATTELAFVFDPKFFASATYPVVVDPAPIQQVSPHRDGYVDQSHATTNYESNVNLELDPFHRTPQH